MLILFRNSLLLLFTIASFLSQGQNFRLTPLVGLNLGGVSEKVWLKKSEKVESRNSITTQYGLGAEWIISRNVSLVSSATIIRKNYSYGYWFDNGTSGWHKTVINSAHYLEIPLIVRYTNILEPTKWYAEAGPYSAYKIADNSPGEPTMKYDAGFVIGTGYLFKLGETRLQFGLRWVHGLLARESQVKDVVLFNRTASAILGLSLPVGKKKDPESIK